MTNQDGFPLVPIAAGSPRDLQFTLRCHRAANLPDSTIRPYRSVAVWVIKTGQVAGDRNPLVSPIRKTAGARRWRSRGQIPIPDV